MRSDELSTLNYGIVSVDDHVVEPPDLWTSRLPARHRDAGPRVGRQRLTDREFAAMVEGAWSPASRSDDGFWADVWLYEDVRVPNLLTMACAGVDHHDVVMAPVLFEDMRPGCFDPVQRLADMDLAGVEISMCFPNGFVRFCGQRFLAGTDKSLALACVKAYNDWVVEEWAAPSGGRLVPCCIVPLWDCDLAVREVRRNAMRGVRSVSFPELPAMLELSSIHGDYWDPLWRVCAETDTVVNLHLGSGSYTTPVSDGAPGGVGTLLIFVTPAMALSEWLMSGVVLRHPGLRIALAESGIGWIPYVLERADTRWLEGRGYQPEWSRFANPPSQYFASNMFASFFNDLSGLLHIDRVGVLNHFGFDNLTFETDYPHSDGTWPNSRQVAERLVADLSAGDAQKLLRDNGRRQLGLA